MMDTLHVLHMLIEYASGVYVQYNLPFILVGLLALAWFVPGLLARAAGRLVYHLSSRAVKGVASENEVVLERGAQGYRLRNFTADSNSLQLHDGPYEVTRLAVEEAQLLWPSWKQKVLQLQFRGLQLEVLQRQMPEAPVPPPAPSSAPQLAVLEQLLWQGSGVGSTSGGGHWGWLRQWLLKAALGFVQLQLEDCRCQYVVQGQLGPAAQRQQQQRQPQQQRDGIAISIRSVVLAPRGDSAAAAATGPAGVDGVPLTGRASPNGPTPSKQQRSAIAKKAVTQLTVTGMNIAVMSSQPAGPAGVAVGPDAAPAVISSCKPALAADLAACLAEEGWQQAHVILKQWQCSVEVHARHNDKAHAAEEAAGQQDAGVQQPLPAVSLKFKSAGAAQIDNNAFDSRSQAAKQDASSSSKEGSQDGGSSSQRLWANVEMKSLVLVLVPNAAAIASRVLSRHSQYQLLSPIWSVRPKQPVSAAPALWWQHACSVVLAECRRRRAPSSMRQALDRRRSYIALYRTVHAHQPGYMPGGSKYRHSTQHSLATAAEQALTEAESTMTVCEIATHRIFVALQHSRHLCQHPALQQQWIEALDGLGGFVDLIPGRGQGVNPSEPGLAVSLRCPTVAIKLVSDAQPQTAQLIAELRSIEVSTPAAGNAAVIVQQIQVLLNSSSTSSSFSRGNSAGASSNRAANANAVHADVYAASTSGYVPLLQLPKMDNMRASVTASGGYSASSSQQAAAAPTASSQTPRPSALGRIYKDSLISTYISKLEVQLGPILLQLQPQLALQVLDYFKAVRAFDTTLDSLTDSVTEKVVPLKQMVLDSFKCHKSPLSFALTALLPVLDISCPQLAVLAALKHVHLLDGNTCGQAPSGTAVEIVARLQKLHASVGYNSSCYSSLLQQADATADAEVFFAQRTINPAVGQQQLAHYAAVWMHPDDVAQLDTTQYGPGAFGAAPAARKSQTPGMVAGGGGARLRSSVMGLFGSGAMPGLATPPVLAATQPFVPLVKLQRVWARLTTHIPTEPAVLGGEHTTAGVSSAGLLLWVSPWQVRLVNAAVEQLAEEGLAMWQHLQSSFSQPKDAAAVFAAAREVADAAATDLAIREAQEAGGTAAAASKIATAYVQAAGALGPAGTPTAAGRQAEEQQQQQRAAAQHASRKAAEQASLSLLVMLPYCEVICFVDLGCGSFRASSQGSHGHRYDIQPAPCLQTITLNSRPLQQDPQQQQQPQQQTSLLQQWGSRIAPVSSLVLCGLRAGTSTSSDGELAAKLHLSSLLLVNLQLLDLCKDRTMPSAAGVYLPAGHVLPATQWRSTRGAMYSQHYRTFAADAPAAVTPAAESEPVVPCLSANYNAFVLSPFTPRLTAAYQLATLSRRKLLGLSKLASVESVQPATASGPPGCIARGQISRQLLVQQRWQSVLELRAFPRSLDYAMFLLFKQERQHQQRESVTHLCVPPFEQYQLLYRYSRADWGAAAAQPEPLQRKHAGWFGSRRSSRATSNAGGLSAAGGAAVPGGPAVFVQPGSPCNWRNAAFSIPVVDKLVAAELMSGSLHSRRSSVSDAPEVISGNGLLSREQQQQRFMKVAAAGAGAASRELPVSTSAGNGVAAHQQSNGTAASPPTATAAVCVDDESGSSAFTQNADSAVFAALSSLRAGSAAVLASAAQQLRLQQRKHPKQQQQQPVASVRRASLLGDSSKASHGLQEAVLSTPAQCSAGQGSSSLPDIHDQSLQRFQCRQAQQMQHPQDAGRAGLEYSVVDFLDRFASNFMAVNLNSALGSGRRNVGAGSSWTVPQHTSTSILPCGSPAGTPKSAADWAFCTGKVGSLQQNQLVVTYTQQPPATLQEPSRPSGQATSAAGLAASHGRANDSLTVCLAHVKVVLGPHSVSMMLQLMAGITSAKSSASKDSSQANARSASQQHGMQRKSQASTGQGTAAAAPGHLSMRLQLPLCHVKLNMERPPGLPRATDTTKAEKAAEQHGVSDKLQTKDLLSLLLLDADASAHTAATAPDPAVDSSGNDATEMSCSVAHVGLQDLCACVEQRHVLSGASQPFKASTTPEYSPYEEQRKSACHFMVQAVVPRSGGTAEQPMLLTVFISNPRLVLVRRFVNNVLYVVSLVNHEVEAAGRQRSSSEAKASRPVTAAVNCSDAHVASSAVVLVRLSNVQVVMPRSHACKTLIDKYALVDARHVAAKAMEQQKQPGAEGYTCCCSCDTAAVVAAEEGGDTPAGSIGTPSSVDSAGSICGNLSDKDRLTTLPPMRSSSMGAGQGLPADPRKHAPLHAYHPEVVLSQVSDITVAAPAEPELLQLAHSAMPDAAGNTPLWMREPAAVQVMLANSRAILASSGGPAAAGQQAQKQQQGAGSSSPGNTRPGIESGDAAAATAAVSSTEPAAGEQRQGQETRQPPGAAGRRHVQFTVGRKNKPAAAVRHGVLMVTDDGAVDDEDVDAASPMPSFSLSAAASRVWKRLVARVAPRRRRKLVVKRDGSGLAGTPDAAGNFALDAAGALRTAAGAPQQTGQQSSCAAGVCAAAARPLDDTPAAHLLLDFSGFELLAAKMQREQDTCSQGPTSNQAAFACWSAGGCAYSNSRCRLTDLTHLITRTNIQAAMHELITAATPIESQAAPAAASVLALAAPDGLALQFSACTYRCLMDTIYGNLLMPHATTFQELPVPVDWAKDYNKSFNPGLVFGPAPGQKPSFGVTLNSSAIQATLFADKRWWTTMTDDQQLQHASSNAAPCSCGETAGSDVQPFVSNSMQHAALCVQMMQGTWDTHVNLWSADTEWVDVRMANCISSRSRSPEQAPSRAQDEFFHPVHFRRSTGHSDTGATADHAGAESPDAAAYAAAAAGLTVNTGFQSGRVDTHYSRGDDSPFSRKSAAPYSLEGEIEPGLMAETAAPDADAVREATRQRTGGFRGPATASPSHLHSARLQRRARLQEESDDEASLQRLSSDDAIGEQQLGTSELFPALLQLSEDGAGRGADVTVIRTLDELPAEESAHLSNKGKRHRSFAASTSMQAGAHCPMADAGFKLHVGYLGKDGTMTVEVVLANTIVQWPYLTDMSLVSPLINIFYSAWGQAPLLPPAWLQLRENPWLYFNLVITNSQIVMPLLTPHMEATGADEPQARSPFSILRDVVTRQASGLTAADIDRGRGQPLEQLGLALSFGALRFGYFFGGDGEAITRFDVRNIAGFIRDNSAVITNWLLPLSSAKLELRQAWPLVEEHKALQPLLMTCRKMRLYYLRRKWHKEKKQQRRREREGLQRHLDALAETGSKNSAIGRNKRDAKTPDAASGSYATSAARNAASAAAAPEQRLLALACEHAEEITGERISSDWHNTWARHGHAQPAQASGMFGQSSSGMFGVYKRKARSELLIVVAPVTLRAAFSNIAAWKTLQEDLKLAGKSMGSGLGMWPPHPSIQEKVLALRAAGDTWPPPPTGWAAEFRRSSFRCSIALEAAMLMLCDDKPHSFGAPDVLQAVAKGVSIVRAYEVRFPRTAPERADKLHIEGGLGVNILNNSNSKWEVMLEPWPLLVSLCDPINPLAKADRTQYGQALSSEPMRVNFHPSSLLSIGDLLAFLRELSVAQGGMGNQQQLHCSTSHGNLAALTAASPQCSTASAAAAAAGTAPAGFGRATVVRPAASLAPQESQRLQQQRRVRRMGHAEAPPSIEQQMALAGGVTSRIPQRYLIQNLTGSHLWYWACQDESAPGMKGAKRRVLLPAHSMQELKVSPALHEVRHQSADGSLLTAGLANAISIQLAGSWLPLESVAVDVVGKYRYEVRNPLGGPTLPLVLDVLLVGRTKMLRLHSCIWLENKSSIKLQPCIQLGAHCNTPVVLGPGDKLDSLQRLHLKALKPREGRFLPVAAALDGMLILTPEGHLPAEHDVLQLKTNLLLLKKQEGYIACQPKPDGIEHGVLHLAATVHPGLQSDPYFTTQNLMEVPRPGTLRRARQALEASIHISPTLQLSNGLPYDVLGWALVPPSKDLARSSGGLQQASKAAGAARPNPDGLHIGTNDLASPLSITGANGVAQAAAVAAASSSRAQPTGLQQVWQAATRYEASIALARVVAAASSAEHALQQATTSPLTRGSPAVNQAAANERDVRNSWFGYGSAGGSGSNPLGRGSGAGAVSIGHGPPSPGPGRAARAGSIGASASRQATDGGAAEQQQDKVMQLSVACELLLMQRWCRDLVLEEFLKTLHLVLSPAMAAAVDDPSLWLLDLPSLVALAFGVLAEEFAWIARDFSHAFGLLLRVEEAMQASQQQQQQQQRASSASAATENSAEAPASHLAYVLPWAENELPVAELMSLLHWLQQNVVRLQLPPGGSADLYLDPNLEVYAAMRVPLLAMQSRPTLISGGNTGRDGAEMMKLVYTKSLDFRHTLHRHANSSNNDGQQLQQQPSQQHSDEHLPLAGLPRLGLAALDALIKANSVHEEVRMRMTSAAKQLAELSNRKKITPLAGHSTAHPVYHQPQQRNIGGSTYMGSMPAAVISLGSATGSGPGVSPQLHTWSSAPSAPYSSAVGTDLSWHTSGLQLRAAQPYSYSGGAPPVQPSVPEEVSRAAVMSWFAVVVELLGDVVRLAMHEAAILYELDSSDQQQRWREFNPGEQWDVLEVAHYALYLIGKALQDEASAAAAPKPAGGGSAAAELQPGSKKAQFPRSINSRYLADTVRGTEDLDDISVDVPMTMTAVCNLLVYPPQEVDRLFTRIMIDKSGPLKLSDQEMADLLNFSCKALVDNVIQAPPAQPEAAAAATSAASMRRAATPDSNSRQQMHGLYSKQGSPDRHTAVQTPQAASSLSSASGALGSASLSSTAGSSAAAMSSTQRPSRLQPVWKDNPMFKISMDGSEAQQSGGVSGTGEIELQLQPARRAVPVDADRAPACPAALPATPDAGVESYNFGVDWQLHQQHQQQQQHTWYESAGKPHPCEEKQQQAAEQWEQLQLEETEAPATPPVTAGPDRSMEAQIGSPKRKLAAAALSPLRGLRSLRTLLVHPPGTPNQAGQPDSSSALVLDPEHAAAAVADEGAGLRPQASTGLRQQPSAGRHLLPPAWHRRTASSSAEASEESSEDEQQPASPRARNVRSGSFRARPGASFKQVAHVFGRVSGAKLVHQQLSDYLRRNVERYYQSMPPGQGPWQGRAPGLPLQGSLRQYGAHFVTATAQSMWLGAMAAEIQEGKAGFCAPSTLQLSLLHSGTHLGPSQNSSKSPRSGSGSKASAISSSSTVQHVLVTASFWLDNRSGVNLVLSDLDRRWLKGLPGPGLEREKKEYVHSPGLPRDCAATETNEPNLTSILTNAAQSMPTGDGSTADAATTAGVAASTVSWAREGNLRVSNNGAVTEDSDVEKALSRLQEVRPALLNNQAWLRFWVEEHTLSSSPPGSKVKRRSRVSSSFQHIPVSTVSGSATASLLNAASSDGGAMPIAADKVETHRSEPSGFFKIAVTGSKTDIKVKGKKFMAELTPCPEQQPGCGDTPAGTPTQRWSSSAARPASVSIRVPGLAAAEHSVLVDYEDSKCLDPAVAKVVPVQRLFEFAAEVWSTPADGPFRATKVVSIKSKYILFNDTGMVLEYKQKGTPDPNHPGYLSYGKGRRFAGQLQPQERCAFHWDNINEKSELVIRPAAPGWPWSGAFPLPDSEDYFGIRLRNRDDSAVIIPVNSTVGRSGSVLITFKSTSSVPPYRIENRTKSVMVFLRQQLGDKVSAGSGVHGAGGAVKTGTADKDLSAPRATVDLPAGWAWDSLAPGSSIPFAWDMYNEPHIIEVAASVLGPGGSKPVADVLVIGKRNTCSYDLDNFKNNAKAPHYMEIRGSTTRTLRSTRSTTQTTSTGGAPAATALEASEVSRTGSCALDAQQLAGISRSAQLQQLQHQPGRQLVLPARAAHPSPGLMVPAASSSADGYHGAPAGSLGVSKLLSSSEGTAGSSEYVASRDGAVAADGDGQSSGATVEKVSRGAVFDKKVYVSMYADGPTQVLCFSDSPLAGSGADEQSGTQQLMSRLHQVARQLIQVERQLGFTYSMRTGRGSRPVPAMLLLQQQQQQPQQNAPGSAAGTATTNLPLALKTDSSAWNAGGTTTAAVAMMQQMNMQHTQAAACNGSLTADIDQPSLSWSQTEGATAAGQYLSGANDPQASYTLATTRPGSQPPSSSSAVRATQLQLAGLTTAASHISNQVLAGAAAAAGAGVRVSNGLVAVDGVDGGLQLYYDKLTLLLDSGLPLGGNCKVKLQGGRGLVPSALADRVDECQVRLVVPGHSALLTGRAAQDKDGQCSFGYEDQFTEVTALSELTVEVWGLPYASMFSGRRSNGQPRDNHSKKPDGSTGVGHSDGHSASRRAWEGTVADSSYGSQNGSLPSGSIFLGSVTIPLMQTLPGTAGSRNLCWYNLMRQTGGQNVTGQVQAGFSWSFTRETLLACELRELEKLLAARQEVLAKLNPLSAARVVRLMGLPAASYAADNTASTVAEAGSNPTAAGATSTQVESDDWEGSTTSDDTGDSGSLLTATSPAGAAGALASDASPRKEAHHRHHHHSSRNSVVSCPNVFSGLDLGMADSAVVSLEVSVMEVAHLSPRSGWSQDLTHALLSSAAVGSARGQTNMSGSMLLNDVVKKSDLPLPVVYVFCGSGSSQDAGFEVGSGIHALNPVFASNVYRFEHVGLRSVLRVLVYDRRSALDSRLLGVASLPAAAVPASSSGPVYMWVPLSAPASWSRGRFGKLKGYMPNAPRGKEAALSDFAKRARGGRPTAYSAAFLPQQTQPPQVLLRIHVVKPATHNTTAALQLNLEGLQLNAKNNGGDELLNLTVSTVQCAFLNTTRERQLSLSVLSVQLDNQQLETRHPVVLSPATLGEDVVVPIEERNSKGIVLTTDKTLEDMDSPAQSMAIAVARSASSSSSRTPAALAATANGKQLQLATSSTTAAPRRMPLIRVSICQTLTKPLNDAASSSAAVSSDDATKAGTVAAPFSLAAASKGAADHGSSANGSSNSLADARAVSSQSAVSKAAIMSFKKVEFLMGALDLKTDQAFLEAVYIFVQSMPLADLWQDETWQQHVAMLQGATTSADSSDAGVRPAEPEAATAAALAGIQSNGLTGRGSVAAFGQPAGGYVPPVMARQMSATLAGRRSVGALRRSAVGAGQPRVPSGSSGMVTWHQGLEELDPTEQQRVMLAATLGALQPMPESGTVSGDGTFLPVASDGVNSKAAKSARRATAASKAALASALVLAWLPEKHEAELSSMKGQSSTWYFLEKFTISSLCVNVTVALTNKFMTTAGAQGGAVTGAGAGDEAASRQQGAAGSGGMLDEMQRFLVKGMINRLSGDSGLQLINVSDVGLQLGAVQMENRLLNQVGLASHLYRHYRWAAVAQSRKVLGGTGPGLVQIPTSILWAGVSMVDLSYELFRSRRIPLSAPFAFMHVMFTLFSQLVGVSSRFVIAMLALVPVERDGRYSDNATLQHYVRMPGTAGEAFYQAGLELWLGIAAAAAGCFLDPRAGLRLQGAWGIAGFMLGVLKASGGLVVRPTMGVIDASSKCLRGMGLLCLGRRGIQGKLVRRVRAPGAAEGPSAGPRPTGALALAGQRRGAGQVWLDEAALHAALIASWQARLPALTSELQGDTVMDVLATRSCRLLLLTRKHVLYIKAALPTRGKDAGSCSYSISWLLPCDRVDHVRGAEENLRITLEYHSQLLAPEFSAWRRRRSAKEAGEDKAAGNKSAAQAADEQTAEGAAGSSRVVAGGGSAASRPVLLRVPLHHSLRCASAELYQQVIKAISRHLVRAEATSRTAVESAAATAAAASTVGFTRQAQIAGAQPVGGGMADAVTAVVQEVTAADDTADLYCVG